LVQHHLRFKALRFDAEAQAYLNALQAADDESFFCLATNTDDAIEVIGMTHYRLTGDDLYFEHVAVREAFRQREVGRRMLTEVVSHPTCLRVGRIHWSCPAEDGSGLVRHLAWLRDHTPRLCGTSFALVVAPPG